MTSIKLHLRKKYISSLKRNSKHDFFFRFVSFLFWNKLMRHFSQNSQGFFSSPIRSFVFILLFPVDMIKRVLKVATTILLHHRVKMQYVHCRLIASCFLFHMSKNLCLMEVSAVLYRCTYCVFILYGRLGTAFKPSLSKTHLRSPIFNSTLNLVWRVILPWFLE